MYVGSSLYILPLPPITETTYSPKHARTHTFSLFSGAQYLYHDDEILFPLKHILGLGCNRKGRRKTVVEQIGKGGYVEHTGWRKFRFLYVSHALPEQDVGMQQEVDRMVHMCTQNSHPYHQLQHHSTLHGSQLERTPRLTGVYTFMPLA